MRRKAPPERDPSVISLLATIPPVLTAIRFAGDGGCRLMLDISEDQEMEAVALLGLRGVVLRVTFASADEEG